MFLQNCRRVTDRSTTRRAREASPERGSERAGRSRRRAYPTADASRRCRRGRIASRLSDARPFRVPSLLRVPVEPSPTRLRLPPHVSTAWIWRPPSAMLMSPMELNQIEAFVAIVRGGGFTRASATLHLSQPAISRRLHLLEDELGAPLFERIRSGAVLTEAGRAF